MVSVNALALRSGKSLGSMQLVSFRVRQTPFVTCLILSGQHLDRPPVRLEHPAPPHDPQFLSQQATPSASTTPLIHQPRVAEGSQQGACSSTEHCVHRIQRAATKCEQ